MKILALIPARGGSKRLPGKNIKLLGGLPLIAWTIRSALESDSCCDVLVSTDDQEIAAIAQRYGAMAPWLRPDFLANDTATSVDMALHALDKYEFEYGQVDAVMLLQPTSPFRSQEAIKRAVTIYNDLGAKHAIVSVSPASCHPAWAFRHLNDHFEPFLGWNAILNRSQELEPAWMLNGSIYLISVKKLRSEKTFLSSDSQPLFMDETGESLDIDTQEDFEYCEFIENKLAKKVPMEKY